MFKAFDPFSTIGSLLDILDIDWCLGLFISQSDLWLEEFDQFTFEFLVRFILSIISQFCCDFPL